MTRLDRLLNLLDRYEYLVDVAISIPGSMEDKMVVRSMLMPLRKEKDQLTQELIEHGCRRKN